MAETCCEQRSKVTITSCISGGYILYEINGIKVVLNCGNRDSHDWL
jgi:hypothetical protein